MRNYIRFRFLEEATKTLEVGNNQNIKICNIWKHLINVSCHIHCNDFVINTGFYIFRMIKKNL